LSEKDIILSEQIGDFKAYSLTSRGATNSEFKIGSNLICNEDNLIIINRPYDDFYITKYFDCVLKDISEVKSNEYSCFNPSVDVNDIIKCKNVVSNEPCEFNTMDECNKGLKKSIWSIIIEYLTDLIRRLGGNN